jgi:hypothetical protein
MGTCSWTRLQDDWGLSQMDDALVLIEKGMQITGHRYLSAFIELLAWRIYLAMFDVMIICMLTNIKIAYRDAKPCAKHLTTRNETK